MPELSDNPVTEKVVWGGEHRGRELRVMAVMRPQGRTVYRLQTLRDDGWHATFPISEAELTEILGGLLSTGLVQGRESGIEHERRRCLAICREKLADESDDVQDSGGRIKSMALGAADAAKCIVNRIKSGERIVDDSPRAEDMARLESLVAAGEPVLF